MKATTSYDQNLRVIGQALESRRINVCHIESEGDTFAVHGMPERTGAWQGLLQKLQGLRREESGPSKRTYSLSDLDLLEREGRAKRRAPGKLPDFYSLSSVLRTVGAYLDLKQARLLQVHKRPMTVSILYETKEGHPDMEERTIASFYHLFLQLYDKREQKNPSAKIFLNKKVHKPNA